MLHGCIPVLIMDGVDPIYANLIDETDISGADREEVEGRAGAGLLRRIGHPPMHWWWPSAVLAPRASSGTPMYPHSLTNRPLSHAMDTQQCGSVLRMWSVCLRSSSVYRSRKSRGCKQTFAKSGDGEALGGASAGRGKRCRAVKVQEGRAFFREKRIFLQEAVSIPATRYGWTSLKWYKDTVNRLQEQNLAQPRSTGPERASPFDPGVGDAFQTLMEWLYGRMA